LQSFGNKTLTNFTATDIAFIAAQKLAKEGVNYWDATTRTFKKGRSDGGLDGFAPQTDRMLSTGALATISTNKTAPSEGALYWDTVLRKLLRGAADNSLEDFLIWFGS